MLRKRWPAVLAALAMLLSGMTHAHAHVHLCFDGQEPPASLHGAHDGDLHHEHEQTGDHDDLDVDLDEQGLAKSSKPELPAVAAPPVHVLAAAEHGTIAPSGGPDVRPRPAPPFLRPYLRAPPPNLA